MENKDEVQKLCLHIKDLIIRTEKSGVPSFTDFIDEGKRVSVENYIEKFHSRVNFVFWGGYEDAFRTVLGIFDIYSDIDSDMQKSYFPFNCITAEYRKDARLTHRDFLGAFMGLGLKRDVIGDIVVSDGITQCFIKIPADKVILNEILQVGRYSVKVSEDVPFAQKAAEFSEISGTVASLRLDAIVHVATNLSRENASELIRRGLVLKNGVPSTQVSDKAEGGDIISVRGHGKYRLKDTGSITKKGRIRVCIEKYK